MGVSWNGGTPINTPKMIILVGKAMVVGYRHFRKPPYGLFMWKLLGWLFGLGILSVQQPVLSRALWHFYRVWHTRIWGSWGLFCHCFCWLKTPKFRPPHMMIYDVQIIIHDEIHWLSLIYDLMVLRILYFISLTTGGLKICSESPSALRPRAASKKRNIMSNIIPKCEVWQVFCHLFWGWWRWYSPYCQSCHIFLRSTSTWSFWWDFSTPSTLSSQVLEILRLQVLGSKPWVDQSPVMFRCFVGRGYVAGWS